MKRFSRTLCVQTVCLGGLLVLLLTDTALAAQEGRSWRPIYDQAMEWLNFSILVFVIIKFGRVPLMNFLRGQRDDIEKNFNKIESQKDQVMARLRESVEALEESKVRLPALKVRLIEQGERRKMELIEEARQQSSLLMEGARHKIEYQVLLARKDLSKELLDMAVEEAIKRLPSIITAEDDQRQVEKYLAAASR